METVHCIESQLKKDRWGDVIREIKLLQSRKLWKKQTKWPLSTNYPSVGHHQSLYLLHIWMLLFKKTDKGAACGGLAGTRGKRLKDLFTGW